MSSRRSGRSGHRACERSLHSAARGLHREFIDRDQPNYRNDIFSFLASRTSLLKDAV
jgi:hypothetical protein